MSTIPPRRIRTDLIRIKLAEIRDGISVVRENLPGEEAEFLRLGLIKDGIYKKPNMPSKMSWISVPCRIQT